jgi:hypothetical protein
MVSTQDLPNHSFNFQLIVLHVHDLFEDQPIGVCLQIK